MTSKIHVARLALAQLVAEARPDWDRDDFDGLLHSALDGLPEAGRPAVFASLLLRTARLLGVDDSSAADLRHEARSPVSKPPAPPMPVDAERRDELLGPARTAMARASAEFAAARDRGGDAG